MHARSATISADPQRIDDGIRLVRDELTPAVTSADGCVGLSMVCDHDSGRCIVTTSWASEAALRATGDQRDLLEHAAHALGGDDVTMEEWEIVVMHRSRAAGDGCCARITWTRCDPAVLTQVLDDLPLTLLPRLDDAKGFCSLSLFVDRTTGRCAATAVYESRQVLEASRERISGMRDELRRQLEMEITEVAEFDLVLHQLRVPELV